jgi:glutathione S-transferase
MAIEIFWASGSGFSWRVLLALELKKLPYESHLLQFSQRDHKAPSYLAMNPRGRVPTLRDGDTIVYESVACLAYLDRKYPEVPLFGATPEETGRIWRAVCECVAYFDDPCDRLILPLYFGKEKEQEAQIRAAAPVLAAELDLLEANLGKHRWVASSDVPSAADCVVYPMIRSVERAAGKPAAAEFDLPFSLLRTRYPSIAAWMERVESLPGYDKTYPPHWR